MGIRETLSQQSRKIQLAFAGALLLVAAVALTLQFKTEHRANLSQAFFTDDDGKTWFADDAARIPPFEHKGKIAVSAQVFSYADGKKQFCGYMAKYTDEAKKKLDAAIAEAKAKGQPPESVGLIRDPAFRNTGMVVKSPGANNPWVGWTDPRSHEVFSVRSPDGSAVDQVFVD